MACTFSSKKFPAETRSPVIDASADLDPGETLTSIVSTTITAQNGINSTSLVVSQEQINTTQLNIITSAGAPITVPVAMAVQFTVTGGLDGVWYQIAFLVTTSNPGKTIEMVGVLQVSASC